MNPNADLEVWVNGLLNVTAQALLLVPVILLIQWLFKRQLTARWRHALWWLLVIRLLVPISVTSPFSVFNFAAVNVRVAGPELPAPGTESHAKGATPSARGAADERQGTGGELGMRNWTGIPQEPTEPRIKSTSDAGASTTAETATRPDRATGWRDTLLPVIIGVWLFGVLLLLLVVCRQTMGFAARLRRSGQRPLDELAELMALNQKRMAVRRRVELIETNAVASPVLYGLLRLRILLPTGFAERFSREELQHVLRHELAHVKRGDLWLNWLVTLLQLIHWFNPLVWFGFARMRADRELACDELALLYAEEGTAGDYGRTIVKLLEDFARPTAVPGLVGILEDKQQMERRINMIAKFKRPGRWSALAALLIGAVGLVTLTDAQNRTGVSTVGEPAEDFTTIDMTPYYDKGERSDFDGHDNGWRTFPKGDHVFQGIPFNARGFVMLEGKSLAAIKNFPLQKSIGAIPIGRKFEQLHMLQGAAFRADEGTVLATLRLDYEDGKWVLLPIAYGEQTADLWRSSFESPVELAENSRLGWVAIPPSVEGGGLSTRVFLTSFDNPHPDRKVSSVSVISAEAKASVLVVGITVGRSLNTDERAAIPDLVDPQEPTDSTLVVRVVQGQSKSPVPYARLKAHGTYHRFGANFGELAAGPDGVISLRYASDMSNLVIEQIGSGFAPASVNWRIERGEQVPEEFTLKLYPAMEIGGTVEDDRGNPVVGAEVRLSSLDATDQQPDDPVNRRFNDLVETDSLGRWRSGKFAREVQMVSIVVSHESYGSADFVTDTSRANFVRLDDLLNQSAKFILQSGIMLSGTVVDSSSAPIAGATVVLGETPSNAKKITVSDQNGRFEFSGLTPGRQMISVRAEGFAPDFERQDVKGDVHDIVFRLEPGHTYKGRITEPDGSPVGGAYVSVASWLGSRHLDETTSTDSDGYYVFNSLPGSGLKFRLWRAGYLDQWNVEPNSPSEESNFVLHPIRTIAGKVTDASTGEPVSSFQVTPGRVAPFILTGRFASVAQGQEWYAHQAVTAYNGEFKVDLRETGDGLVVKIDADGYQPKMSEAFSSTNVPPSLNFELERGNGPRGVVINSNGDPVSGVSVCFVAEGRPTALGKEGFVNRRSRPSGQLSTTDADGRFEFKPELNGVLLVATDQHRYGEVEFDANVSEYRIVLRPLGAVRGSVHNPSIDISNASVILTSGPHAPGLGLAFEIQDFNAPVDADGRFVMAGVPPGKRMVSWVQKGDGRTSKQVMTKEIVVLPGQTTEVEFSLPGRVVEGRAVAGDGQIPVIWQQGFLSKIEPEPPSPIRSRAEAIAWQNSPEMQEYRKGTWSISFNVLPDGRFSSLEPVASGEYTLSIGAYDPNETGPYGSLSIVVASVRKDVTIEEGQTVQDLGTIEIPMLNRPRVGMPAPDFTAVAVDGNPFSLADFAGHRTVVRAIDLGHYYTVPERWVSNYNASLEAVRQVAASTGAMFVNLTTPAKMGSATSVVVAEQLPYVLGAVSESEFHRLSALYQSYGVVVVGVDGRVEFIVNERDPVMQAKKLEELLAK